MIGLAQDVDYEGYINQHIALARPANIKNSEFIAWYLSSTIGQKQLRNNQRGATKVGIGLDDIRGIRISLPPYEEQLEIVRRIRAILPLIEKYGKAYTSLQQIENALPDQLRASLLQEAIQGKLVPQLDDEPAVEIDAAELEEVPFAIPEKWRWISLGDAIVYGKAEQSIAKDIPKEAWVLDLEDIQKERGIILQKKRNVSSTSNKNRFYRGNVLYSKLRPYLNKVVVADEDGYCTTEIVPIDPLSNGYEIDADYLKTYLMSPYFVHYANERAYGVKMPRLGTKDAKLAAFPLPPIAEQRRIVERLEKLLPNIDTVAYL